MNGKMRMTGWAWGMGLIAAGLAALTSAAADPAGMPSGLTGVPGQVSYQATLWNAGGTNHYADNVYSVEFRLYKKSSDDLTNAVWGAAYHVYVKNGQFSVMLGNPSGESLTNTTYHAGDLWKAFWSDASADPAATFYLGMKVPGMQSECLPRQQLLCAPFAFRAHQSVYASKSAGDFAVGGQLSVTNVSTFSQATTQHLTVQSNLTIQCAATLDKTLEVKGAATLDSTLHVTGAATLDDKLIVAKTLEVKGAATLDSTLEVKKAATLDDTLEVKKAATLDDTLKVTGAATIVGSLTVEGYATVADKHVTVAEENLRIVRGTINKNNSARRGTGYTVQQTNDGDGWNKFTVSFDQAFLEIPTITTSVYFESTDSPWGAVAYIYEQTTTSFSCKILSVGGSWLDLGFSFIAIGPR